MSSSSWDSFYEKTRQAGAHRTTLTALRLFEQDAVEPGFCVDIGCGEGLDSVAAIENGWTVLAIDREQAALERLHHTVQLRSAPNDSLASRLKLFCGSMEQLDWPGNHFTNASLSLPFCPRHQFPELWQRVVNNLLPGGRFAGHFFGDRDGWVSAGHLVHLSREQVSQLFEQFSIELFEEDERDYEDINGIPKHWHIFHVVAKRL